MESLRPTGDTGRHTRGPLTDQGLLPEAAENTGRRPSS